MLIKNKLILIFILVLFTLSSCDNKKEDGVKKITTIYEFFSQKQATKSDYNLVYKLANDTLKHWVKANLRAYDYIRINTWRIDSLICFNQKADRCVMALCKQSTFYKDQDADGITFLYGTKINNYWFFFTGAFIVLPREYYQKDTHTPLSFEKLHEIAMKEVFSGYLIKKKKDAGFWKNTFSPEYEYEVNEEWFDRHFKGSGWGCGYVSDTGWVDTCSVKEFEVLYKRNAISQWIKETQYLVHDTKIYSSINPPNEKWKTTIEKGRQVKLIYYVDDSEWCRVVVTGEMPNGMYDVDESYVKRSDISSNPP